MHKWLESDIGDSGFQILIKDEIVASVIVEATVKDATDKEEYDEQDDKSHITRVSPG